VDEVKRWPALLPLALTPSWQFAQPAVMPWCVNVVGVHASVAWHVLHSAVVVMWLMPLPVARTPSWQLEHVPTTCVWSTFVAGFHALVTWQASHVFDVAR